MSLKISRSNTIPTLLTDYYPGSRVVLPNGKEYILNNSKVWVPLHMMALEVKDNLTTEDLNTVLTFGIYHQKSNTNATLVKNYPVVYAGILKVFVDNDQIFQSYTVLSSQPNENKTYTRGSYAGAWSPWIVPNYSVFTQTEWNTVQTNSHTHSNKTLLDTYTQTNANITSAITNSHTHSNKALLDTYTQTNANIISAITNNHTHANKTVIDGITAQKIINWDLSFSWGNHASVGYLTNTTGDVRYLKLTGVNQQINGNFKLIDTVNENISYYVSGTSFSQIKNNEISLSGFGLTSNILNSTINSFNFGYKIGSDNISFIEYDKYLNKWNLGKDVPIYLNLLKLSTSGNTKTLTIDNSGKIGYIEGVALTTYTETDPTVPSYVKSITSQEKTNWNNIVDNYSNFNDLRIIKPNSIGINKFSYGLTSFNNNNSNPFGDYIHFGGYLDGTTGNQNLIVFNKNSFGIRQYQGLSQANTNYSQFVDYWNTNNFTQDNVDEWNMSFSWGNHSEQGYLQTVISNPIDNDILRFKQGQWINTQMPINSFKNSFLITDWLFNPNGYYQLLINHNLSSDIIKVSLNNSSGIELIPESIVIINNDTVSIRITNQIDLRFAGNLLIIKG